MATRTNCWEFKKCGREPGGTRVAEFGVCPAAKTDMNAVNSGTRGGRICWGIAGTLCGGKIQGTFAQKAATCLACEFYQAVRREEGKNFNIHL